MGIRFEDKALQELFEYGKTKDRRYAKYSKDGKFVAKLARQIHSIMAANSYQELRAKSSLHYEALRYSHSGLSSFRIGNEYVERVICRECKEYIELTLIEIDSTHYGNKK